MILKTRWFKSLLLIFVWLTTWGGVARSENFIPVTIQEPVENGRIDLFQVVLDGEGEIKDIASVPLTPPYKLNKGENYAIRFFPDKGYAINELISHNSKNDGTTDKRILKIKDRKDKYGKIVYKYSLIRYSETTPIISSKLEAKFKQEGATITFKEPNIDDGKIDIFYVWNGKEETVKSNDVVPLNTNIFVTLTSLKPKKRPEVTYKYTDESQIYTIDLNYDEDKRLWVGVFQTTKPLELMIRYVPDVVMVTFIAPTTDKGSMEITYSLAGQTERLVTSGNVPRGVEITITLIKKNEAQELNLSYKGKEAQKPIPLTKKDAITFEGKLKVTTPIQIFAHFGDETSSVCHSTWDEVVVHPNPFYDYLRIQNPVETLSGRYELLTLQGQRLLSGELTEHLTQINTDELPLGVYFLRLTNTNGDTRIERLVKY